MDNKNLSCAGRR